MKQFLLITFAVAITAMLSGCIKEKILVKLNKDGSGRIIVTRRRSKIRTQNSGRIKTGRQDDNIFNTSFSETRLKAKASEFGNNITYITGKKLKLWDGYIAIYAFSNINDVSIPLLPIPNIDYQIEFRYKNDNRRGHLNIVTPRIEKDKKLIAKMKNAPVASRAIDIRFKKFFKSIQKEVPGLDIKLQGTCEDAMKSVVKGGYYSVEIEIPGEIQKSSVKIQPGAKKQRYTIVKLSDRICNDRGIMREVENIINAELGSESARGRYKYTPFDLLAAYPKGFEYENKGIITVEFK